MGAWNVGYNEVFSPYSSPSTDKWNDDTSQIFIWYRNDNDITGDAEIDIYKIGQPYSEEVILQKTPPSRPMWLKADSCVSYNNEVRPYLMWLHKM